MASKVIAALAHIQQPPHGDMIQQILKEPHYSISLHVTGQRTTTLTFAVWSACYSAPASLLHSHCVEKIGGQGDAMDMGMGMGMVGLPCSLG